MFGEGGKREEIVWYSSLVAGGILGSYLAFNHPSQLFVPFCVAGSAPISYFVLVGYWEKRHNISAAIRSWLQHIFFYGFGISMAATLLGGTVVAVNWFLYRLPGKYSNWLSLAVLPIGYSVHYFKRRNLRLYGTIEVIVGVATALGSTVRGTLQPTQGLAIIGAIYVVGRGFNNISEAKQKPKNPNGVAPSQLPLPLVSSDPQN
jgi:hypothetical protein